MKTKPQTPLSSCGTLRRLGWLLLLPALATSLHGQPALTIEDGAVIKWPTSATNYIVQWAPTPQGPWTPCLNPITAEPGYCAMEVACTGACKYFRLAQGQRFEDNFEDGDLDGYALFYGDPQWANYVHLVVTNGQLHIYGTWAGSHRRSTLFCRTNFIGRDVAMSIDILGWDESALGDEPAVGLLGRINPVYAQAGSLWAYVGILNVATASPGWSKVRIYEYNGASSWTLNYRDIPHVNPARDYRLVFYAVGTKLMIQLYDLSTLDLVAECLTADATLGDGWVGFYIFELGSSGTVDFWLDNFVVVATTP